MEGEGEWEKEREKQQKEETKQVMHNAIAYHPLTDASHSPGSDSPFLPTPPIL